MATTRRNIEKNYFSLKKAKSTEREIDDALP